MERIIFTFALLLSTICFGEADRSAGDDDYGHDSYIKMLEAIEQARARIQSHLDQKEVILKEGVRGLYSDGLKVLMSVPAERTE